MIFFLWLKYKFVSVDPGDGISTLSMALTGCGIAGTDLIRSIYLVAEDMLHLEKHLPVKHEDLSSNSWNYHKARLVECVYNSLAPVVR